MAEEQVQLELCALISHPNRFGLSVDQTADGWQLPRASLETNQWWKWRSEAGNPQVYEAWAQKFDVPFYILRRMLVEPDQANQKVFIVYEIEAETANFQSFDTIDTLTLPQHDRDLINRYREEITPPQREQWQRPNWLATLTKWVTDQLTPHGITVQTIDTVRNWSLSYVARIETDQQTLYFKAYAHLPLFGNEGLVMAQLAKFFPDLIPMPLAVDTQTGWMILPEFVGDTQGGGSLAEQERIVRAIAQMQRDSAEHTATLLANGCIDRTLSILATQYEALLQDDYVLGQMTTDELDQLRLRLPTIQQLCQESAESGIPHTIMHGDLHWGNIVSTDDTITIFDWTDAAIAFPFLDIQLLIDFPDEAVNNHLRRIYLSYWTDVMPMEELEALWVAVKPLFAYHHAISYHGIEANAEPASHYELGGTMVKLLRRVIEWTD